ncbi:hypothetical protein Zmor_002248 [Zophobas morio]|uniref:Uncharacterized protein n=1 Tax=Zophobas morio TaxID=2755281 RepID=A0AA38MTF9_9CUCU|nr:hypothetical protein Zmor_002248 [Zophobas morio]
MEICGTNHQYRKKKSGRMAGVLAHSYVKLTWEIIKILEKFITTVYTLQYLAYSQKVKYYAKIFVGDYATKFRCGGGVPDPGAKLWLTGVPDINKHAWPT